jgi:8-oxo-dGTP pyrophosphatase MutT (NUDIX family)
VRTKKRVKIQIMTTSLPEHRIDNEYLQSLQAQAAMENRECVVGGLIVHGRNRVFVQKRSPDRQLYPGCWDIPGGHVEAGETMYRALEREIEEETGWRLVRMVDLVEIFDWEMETCDSVTKKREFDFLVEVSGDLEHPRLEREKFSEFRWIGQDGLDLLMENRTAEDLTIVSLVRKALNRHRDIEKQ